MTLTRYTMFQYFSVSDSLGENQYEQVVYMAHVDFSPVSVFETQYDSQVQTGAMILSWW